MLYECNVFDGVVVAELVINWNPMVRRDVEGFRQMALETQDGALREKALMKAGGVIDALMGEIIRAGYFTDPETLAYAGRKYRKACEEGLELDLRKRLFQEVTAFTQHFDDCMATTYLPFVLEEEDHGIVSTAALDYVSVGKIADDADPMLLPGFLIRMMESRTVRNPGAVFGGLLNTGDPRVCELLWDTRSILNEDEINQACLCQSGFIGAATVNFYLSWLEEIVNSGLDSLFGKLASGLALVRRNPKSDFVFTGMRPFPYGSLEGDELQACLKPVLLDDYTRDIAQRMLKLTSQESDPKVMPDVLYVWGICNLADAKGALIIDDLTERCWDVINDKSLSSDDWYASLIHFVDIGIATGSGIINKVAIEINRRGKSKFWEIVLDRYEMFLEFQRHETPDRKLLGQIIAMPIICSTDIPDEQIPVLCSGIPALPSGEAFKFVSTALRWGELHGNEHVNRLIHTMLFRWASDYAPSVIEKDIATLPSLNHTKSALDEIVVTQSLTLKLRFLVGYRLVFDESEAAASDQRDSWMALALSSIEQRNPPGSLFIRYPSPLRSALYEGQAAMMSYAVYSTLKFTEERHSPLNDERFGMRIECFGDEYTQLARWFTVTSYDLETGVTIANRDIPIALPSTTSRWAAELEEIRVRAERSGCPYVITAPILQSSQMHHEVFEKTKCIKITLGAPMQLETQYTDTLSLDPQTHLPDEKARWDLEKTILPNDVELLRSGFAATLGIEVEELYAWGTYTLDNARWVPTVVILFDGAKCKDGTEVEWPPEKSTIDVIIALADTLVGRNWIRYSIGGLAAEGVRAPKTIEEILQEARGGDLDAQLSMAEMLYEGNRVPTDFKASLEWYRLVALKGHSGAQAIVGYMLEEGMGCDRSDSEAFNWFRLGAVNGDAFCQYKFAGALEEGLHVQKNVREATEWYRKAAEQGHSAAQLELGMNLYWGNDVSQDLIAAAFWFEKAARQGEPAAQYNLGVMLAHGEHAEADRVTALAWLRLSAEQDYDGAEDGLARVSGEMTAREIDQAKALAKQLSDQISG